MSNQVLATVTTALAMLLICHGASPIVPAEVLKTLKAQGTFTIILALHERESENYMSWITRLIFPVQV